ncbi:unnamed protein product [Arctogadus glacialis]
MVKRACPAGQTWSTLLDYCSVRIPEDQQPQPGPPRPPAAKPTAVKPTAAEPTYVTSGVVTAPWTKGSGMWTGPAAGPYLWGAVAVVATGSILALVLWFLIYRQHRNRSNWAPPPALQDTDKTDPLPLAPGSYPAEPLRKDPEPSGPHCNGVYMNDITPCMAGQNDITSCMAGQNDVTSCMAGQNDVTSCMAGQNDITSCMAGQNDLSWGSPRVTWVGETGATGRKHRVPLPATELGDTTLVTAKTGRDQYSPV